jgi:hypothetical protein
MAQGYHTAAAPRKHQAIRHDCLSFFLGIGMVDSQKFV